VHRKFLITCINCLISHHWNTLLTSFWKLSNTATEGIKKKKPFNSAVTLLLSLMSWNLPFLIVKGRRFSL
jgi:hypothetical protein